MGPGRTVGLIGCFVLEREREREEKLVLYLSILV